MKNKIIYLYELILIAFILSLKFIIMVKLPDNYELINSIFWIVSLIVLFIMVGKKRDIHICKHSAVQITVICILAYILITYLSGLFFGFLRNAYSLVPLDIFKNIYSLVIMIFAEEIIRSMVAKNCNKSKLTLIILTIAYIVLDFILVFNANVTKSGLKIFIFVTTILLPNIVRHAFASWMTYKVSYVPGLIVRLYFTLYQYMLPIIPDLGYYLNSLIGVIFPYIIYLKVSKLVRFADKERIPTLKKSLWYINIPAIAVLSVIIILVSGIFKYQLMAIGSGSMEPIYYRGDAIIFEKYDSKQIKDIEIGEILVFTHEGEYVTHRVVGIAEENEKRIFTTKGDNNDKPDGFKTSQDDVIGIVKLRIKYIGLPSLWFQKIVG